MAKRTQGLVDDDNTPAPAQSAAPASGSRTSGLTDEPATAPTTPAVVEAAQPDPHAYKPPDWIPGAGFLYKTNRVLEDAFSMGGLDYATGKAGDWMRVHGFGNSTPSVEQLRAETEQNRKDIGPVASTIAETAGYAAGPGKLLGPLTGKAAPLVGRYGAPALEGIVASGANSAGHGETDPYTIAENAAKSGVAAVGGHAVGDVLGRIVKYLTPSKAFGPRAPGIEKLREDALRGREIRPDIAVSRMQVPPGGAEDQALAEIQRAAAQSIAPGWMASAVKGGTTAGGAALGFQGGGLWGALGAGGITGAVNRLVTDKAAKGINQIDRNININQAFDQLYPAFGRAPVAMNTQPLTDAARQWAIGSSQ